MPLLKDKAKRQQLRQHIYQRLEEDGVTIAETVKTLRRILAQNQAEFAKTVGISLSALRRIEQESGNFQLATLLRILERFNLELRVKPKESK